MHYIDKEGVFYLYDRGIYVAYYNIVDGFSGYINTKVGLNLNFARNDVMSTDETWREINRRINEECFSLLVNRFGELLTEKQRQAIYKKARVEPSFREKIWHKNIIALANDTYTSLDKVSVSYTHLTLPTKA